MRLQQMYLHYASASLCETWICANLCYTRIFEHEELDSNFNCMILVNYLRESWFFSVKYIFNVIRRYVVCKEFKIKIINN